MNESGREGGVGWCDGGDFCNGEAGMCVASCKIMRIIFAVHEICIGRGSLFANTPPPYLVEEDLTT